MPKNPNRRSKPVKRDEPMTGAMKFFLAGCVAELYLLIVRRFYLAGNAEQQIAWYDYYLWVLAGVGAAVFAVGAVLSVLWKADRKKRVIGWYTAGLGAFLAISTVLIRLMNASAVTLLSVVVPVVMLLVILWSLYDRECAVSLTILGVSLVFLWVQHILRHSDPGCRRALFGFIGRCRSAGLQSRQRRRQAGQVPSSALRCRPAAHLQRLRPVRGGDCGGAHQHNRGLLCHVGAGHCGFCSGRILYGKTAVISK